MHIGVFILLLLSGERNFGVRLNKPYTATVPMDIPVFTGVTTSQLYPTILEKHFNYFISRRVIVLDCRFIFFIVESIIKIISY